MSNRLLKKVAMNSIVHQENALKKIAEFRESLNSSAGFTFSSDVNRRLEDIEADLKESLDWVAGIYELGE